MSEKKGKAPLGIRVRKQISFISALRYLIDQGWAGCIIVSGVWLIVFRSPHLQVGGAILSCFQTEQSVKCWLHGVR